MAEVAVPFLKSQGWTNATIYSRTLKFWGIAESTLAEKVHSFFDLQNPTVAPYANHGEVKLRISAFANSDTEAKQLIDPVEQQLRQLGGLDCYGVDDDTLASVVGKYLQTTKATLAVAESCTGGGLGEMITAISGSSSYFWEASSPMTIRSRLGNWESILRIWLKTGQSAILLRSRWQQGCAIAYKRPGGKYHRHCWT